MPEQRLVAEELAFDEFLIQSQCTETLVLVVELTDQVCNNRLQVTMLSSTSVLHNSQFKSSRSLKGQSHFVVFVLLFYLVLFCMNIRSHEKARALKLEYGPSVQPFGYLKYL